MLAIQFDRTGGPEVLRIADLPTPAPGPGEVLVRNQAIALNFIDTYFRKGLYPLALPSGLGSEAAGVVEAVGEGVKDLKPGDRVAYYGGGQGAYAEYYLAPAGRAVLLPEAVSFEVAAASLMKGMTAHAFLTRTYAVQPGDAILIHAAAGGVGSIMTQMAKALGAVVIGTAGSPAKAELAAANGCDHVILYGQEDVPSRVGELTGGDGVRAAYDSVGAATFDGSLASLGRRGWMVTFGNASGPPPAVDPLRLMRGGSLILTRPSVGDFIQRREDLLEISGAVFAAIASGAVKINIGARFALKDAARAHEALESRATTGSTILVP
jgi:NADPH2:quinone reductase